MRWPKRADSQDERGARFKREVRRGERFSCVWPRNCHNRAPRFVFSAKLGI